MSTAQQSPHAPPSQDLAVSPQQLHASQQQPSSQQPLSQQHVVAQHAQPQPQPAGVGEAGWAKNATPAARRPAAPIAVIEVRIVVMGVILL